ncbi:MAG: ribbon-helix-helix protein, CopG family [Planctomycetaceae bacterium]
MMATDRLSIRLPEPLRSGLDAMVEATGRTESDIAREAIKEYLRRHAKLPTCFDLAEEAGIIGCVDSRKGDLSTNLRHMEGFGK